MDLDKLKFVIQNEFKDHDYNGYDKEDMPDYSMMDEFDDTENGDEKIGWLETIGNIFLHPDIHPHHPDINPGPVMVCQKYQLDLYSRIYGLETIKSKDMKQFKASLKKLRKEK